MKGFKKSVAVLSATAMSAAMLLNFPAGMLAVSAEEEHHYDNGFCTDNGCSYIYEPAKDTNNDGYYEIGNAGQLYWFAEYVNNDGADGDHSSANAILTADITINENVLDENGDLNGDGKSFRNWEEPIDEIGFSGCFDGNGKTISGIYMNTDWSNAGLFGIIATGSVSNLNIEDSYFENSGTSIGGICGMNTRNISNCSLSGTIISTSTKTESLAGGICGDIGGGTISGCSFSGKVISKNGLAGGICGGYNSGGSGTKITECSNFGSISGREKSGGICGYGLGFTIRSCYNAGNVTGVNNVGGICGEIYTSTIDSCYNKGTVTGEFADDNSIVYTGNTGGICGYNKSSGATSYISNCYNIGKVANGEHVGEICGYNHCGGLEAVVENCFYPKEREPYIPGVGGTEVDPGCKGTISKAESKSTAQFKSGEVAYLLAQGNSIWGQELGKDYYPVPGGKTVVKNVNGAYENGTIQITGYNLSLADDINLKVNVYIGGGHNANEVTATFNGETINGSENQEAGKNIYTFEYAVPAKDLDKEFKFEIIVDNETETLTTSVNKYLDIISKDAKYAGIANALKTYGKAAKAYFGNGAPIAVNDVSASELSKYQMTLNEENLPDGVEYVGSTLLLNSKTTLRHYFKLDSSIDPDNVKFYADNFDYESLESKSLGNNVYYVDFISECKVNSANSAHSLQIGDKTVIENCSILSYAKSAVSGSDKNLSNLVKAIYLYNKAAVEYSNSNSNS